MHSMHWASDYLLMPTNYSMQNFTAITSVTTLILNSYKINTFFFPKLNMSTNENKKAQFKSVRVDKSD